MKNQLSKKTWMILTCLFTAVAAFGQTWKPNPKYVKTEKVAEKKEMVQCYGTTQKGERCKRKVKGSGIQYCTQHLKQK